MQKTVGEWRGAQAGLLRQHGFTMIELIVVIVILGILAATALPKFVDMSGNAKDSTLKGMVGTATNAMMINYGGCAATSHSTAGGNADKCRTVRYCDDLGNLLQVPMDSSEYTVDHTDLGTVNNTTGTCELTQVSTGNKMNFVGISAGNP